MILKCRRVSAWRPCRGAGGLRGGQLPPSRPLSLSPEHQAPHPAWGVCGAGMGFAISRLAQPQSPVRLMNSSGR